MNLKRIDAAIAGYRDKLDQKDRARLDAFRAVWGVQQELVPAECAWTAPATDAVILAAQQGLPLFLQVPARIDLEGFRTAFSQVLDCLCENGLVAAEPRKALAACPDALEQADVEFAGVDPASFLSSLQGAFMDAGCAEGTARVGALVGSLALKPLLEPAAQRAAAALEAAGLHHSDMLTCPVCGSAPSVARVGSEAGAGGRVRTLWCGQCGTTWEFDRVRCARCGTRNQAHLHFHSIEGDDAHRIASCDECGGYIRTVYVEDDQMLVPFSFEVEDVVMTRLDAVALDPTFASGKWSSVEALEG